MAGRHGILWPSQPWPGLTPSPALPMTCNMAPGLSCCIEHPRALPVARSKCSASSVDQRESQPSAFTGILADVPPRPLRDWYLAQAGRWLGGGWTSEASWPKCVEICSLKGASSKQELIQPSIGSGEEAGLV